MMIPTIHLNGTSKESLLEGLREAIHAVHEAGSALARACPNGRDYYTQGDDAIRKAMAEHESRIQRLRSVAQEVEEIAEAIM